MCQLEVTEWGITFRNQPKNHLGIGVYNDIVLLSVDISYTWLNPLITTQDSTVGLGNTIVPAEQSATVQFFPISSDAIAGGAAQGLTADLVLTINARTIEGTTIRQTLSRQLQVEICQ